NNLIDELSTIPPLPEYEGQITATLREIQKILLDEMPALPLWYNGYWFLASTKYWTGWPSEDDPYAVPIVWNGQWQHGGMLVLLKLKPAIAPPTPAPAIEPIAVAAIVIILVVIIVVVALLLRKKK
ncbi:MAG: hypothetical protein QXE81_06240, partial [Desulfurococcaceae archaeon]